MNSKLTQYEIDAIDELVYGNSDGARRFRRDLGIEGISGWDPKPASADGMMPDAEAFSISGSDTMRHDDEGEFLDPASAQWEYFNELKYSAGCGQSDPDPAKCCCHGTGWWLSNLDSWETCREHYNDQPHPEDYPDEDTPVDWTPPPVRVTLTHNGADTNDIPF